MKQNYDLRYSWVGESLMQTRREIIRVYELREQMLRNYIPPTRIKLKIDVTKKNSEN